jgi:quinol monooxygenase YgiN
MSSELGGSCCLEIEFKLKPGKRREFARSFEELICHEGEGHVKTTVFEDREEPGHMIWVASWSSRESLEAYLKGEQFGVLIGGLRILSSLTDCRLIDAGWGESSPKSISGSRLTRESRFKQIGLESLEGPKHLWSSE